MFIATFEEWWNSLREFLELRRHPVISQSEPEYLNPDVRSSFQNQKQASIEDLKVSREDKDWLAEAIKCLDQ